MTTIALVRHGQTDLNLQLRWQGTTDAVLNDLGHSQAAMVADRLAHGSWNRIITSPLERARQTAAAIARRLDLPDAAVDERIIEQHGGVAEGLLETEIRSRWPDEESIPESETRARVGERGARALTEMAERFSGESLIVVAHGTLIRLTLGMLTGVPHPLMGNGDFVVTTFAPESLATWTLTSSQEWSSSLA